MSYKDQSKQKESQHRYYVANKQLYLEKQREKRVRNRKFVWEYKNGKRCSLCIESHPACLEFHHTGIDGDKEMKISEAATKWGLERLKKEITKCVLLCSNCHQKLHYEETNVKTNDHPLVPLGD